MGQVAAILGIGLGALFIFQEKMLYVPSIPGVPDDQWISADRYGLASEVGIHTYAVARSHAWKVNLAQSSAFFEIGH